MIYDKKWQKIVAKTPKMVDFFLNIHVLNFENMKPFGAFPCTVGAPF